MRFLIRVSLLAVCVFTLQTAAWSIAEFRGLYVDAFHPGFKSHEQVTQMVSAASENNFNAIIVQVRKRGDAYYNSRIEPKAEDIASDYDPLADIIKQAHAAGLQVHAWIAVYEVKSENLWASTPADNVANVHPEWLSLSRDGKHTTNGDRVCLDPGVPAVQGHIVSVIADIAANYAVDGIHLEGARYWGRDSGYNEISLGLFREATGRSDMPADDDPQWCEWRRSQVTKLVKAVKARLAEVRPACVLSASALMPSPAVASMVSLQDWDGWMNEGIVDFVVPMLYVTSSTTQAEVTRLLAYKHARHMYIGVGTFQLGKDAAAQQITDASSADGTVLFGYHYLSIPGAKRVKLSDLKASIFAQPSGIPFMPWKGGGQ